MANTTISGIMKYNTLQDIFSSLNRSQIKYKNIFVNIPTLGFSIADDNWDIYPVIMAKVINSYIEKKEPVLILIKQFTKIKSDEPYPNRKGFSPLKKTCAILYTGTNVIKKLTASELEDCYSFHPETGKPLPQRRDFMYQDVDEFLNQC